MTFSIGDRVEYRYIPNQRNSGIIEGNGSIGTVVNGGTGFADVRWDSNTYWGKQYPNREPSHFAYNLVKITEFVPYDPTQQGDTDEDI